MNDDSRRLGEGDAGASSEWILIDQAIEHVVACIWYRENGGLLRLQVPVSMIARAQILEAIGEGRIRARGPLRVPTDLPGHVPNHWLVRDIPSVFWQKANWDGISGFKNLNKSEQVPWIEVPRAELYRLWPERGRRTMPAPFHAERIAFRDAVLAMVQRFGLNEEGAHARLLDAVAQRNIWPFEAESPGGQAIDLNAGSGLDWRSSAVARAELCSEDVIALWPELVISQSGAIATYAGRSGAKSDGVPAVAIAGKPAAGAGSTPTAADSTAAPMPVNAARPRMSLAQMNRELRQFLQRVRNDAIANSKPFNRDVARKLAEDEFQARITRTDFQPYYENAGRGAPRGRKRKN